MKADEIVDQEKLRVWLNARPDDQRRKEAVTLAQRCACRVFPIFGQAMNTDLARNRKLTALPVLRVNLTSGVYAKAPRPEIDASATLFSIHAAATTADNTRSSASIDAGRAAVNAAGVANGAIATADPVFRANLSTISTNSAIHAATDAASAARSVFTSGHYDIWEQIRADAHIIEAGGDPLDIRLWSISEPDWFKQVDTEMRTIWWESNPADWDFWTRWWDGVLSGQQLDWGLQEAVALIDNEVWKAGPGAVAGAIREIEAWFSKNANVLRAEALLHAALADYSFDAIDRVMRMVPFEEDIRHLRDPARLSAFLDDADSIRDDLEMFSRALAAEGAMQHAGFVRTYLDGVLDELSRARQMNHLRVGRIVTHGKILEEYAASEQVAAEFGPAIHALRSHTQALLDLTRRHFAQTLTRMAPLRDLTSGPDDNQWDLLQDIQRGIKAIASPSRVGLPPLAKDDQAVLLSMLESIERLLRQNDVVATPQAKSSLRREVDYDLALLSVSVALYLEKANAENHGPGKVLDWIETQYKRAAGLVGLWELIKDIPNRL